MLKTVVSESAKEIGYEKLKDKQCEVGAVVETLSVSIRVCLAWGCGAQAGDLFRLLGIVLTGWLCAHCCSALMHDITFALRSASCLSSLAIVPPSLAIVPRFLWQPLHKTANGSFSIRCKGSGPDNVTST